MSDKARGGGLWVSVPHHGGAQAVLLWQSNYVILLCISSFPETKSWYGFPFSDPSVLTFQCWEYRHVLLCLAQCFGSIYSRWKMLNVSVLFFFSSFFFVTSNSYANYGRWQLERELPPLQLKKWKACRGPYSCEVVLFKLSAQGVCVATSRLCRA